MNGLAIPDLRFEQSFTRALKSYASSSKQDVHKHTHSSKLSGNQPSNPGLTESDLKLLNQELDKAEEEEIDNYNADINRKNDTGTNDKDNQSHSNQLSPIEPITPGIVIYAILKDQIFMPLLQGFLWTGLLISIRPILGIITYQGQTCGTWLANALGLNRINKYHRRNAY